MSSRSRSPYRTGRSERPRSPPSGYDQRDSRYRRSDRDRNTTRENDNRFRRTHSDKRYHDRSEDDIHSDNARWGRSNRSTRDGREDDISRGKGAMTSHKRDDKSEKPETQNISFAPNFKPSGLLAAETNTFKGVVLKYNEPPDARVPTRKWRLFVFEGKDELDCIVLGDKSSYLFGREERVADIPISHPSTSKQHAVIQFKQTTYRNEYGDSKTKISPYLIDLDSANGTLINDDAVPSSRLYELKSSDVIKFAHCSKEYVIVMDS